jgi:hypothetical protein
VRRIGTTDTGYLIEVTFAEADVFSRLVTECRDAPRVTPKPAPIPAPAPKPEPAPAPKRKACAVCGREFQPRTSEVTCSPDCKRRRELKQKRAYAAAKTTPKRQAKRQERGLTRDARADRLAELKRVAARMGLREPDPVEAVVAKAGGMVDGD